MLELAPEIAGALAAGEPVVALESAVIAYGLPRPTNLETARSCEGEVRVGGAVPATIALADGRARIGADPELLAALATREDVRKVSTRDLAPVLARGWLGATTVAATVELAALAGIAVFATGGIGGVHRGVERSDDVSADLRAIAAHPVCVVCSGAKAMLDLPRTLERLETLGVPVLTVGADEFPAFTVRSSGLRSPYRADALEEVTAIARLRLRQGGGIVVALPIEAQVALDPRRAAAALDEALAEAEYLHIQGERVTPFLLSSIARREADAVSANVALLRANARFAARLARTLSVHA